MLGLRPVCRPLYASRYFSGSAVNGKAGVEMVDLVRMPDKKSHPDKSRLKKQYLKKFPPIRKDPEGNILVEGVSNKALPCPIPWIEPEPILRTQRHEDGSGDMGSLLDLVGGEVDMTNQRVEIEKAGKLMESPEEVKRALSLEYARNRDLVEYIKTRLIERVRGHDLETDSLCVGIAWLTVGIRNDQEQLDELHNRPSGRKKNANRSISLWRRVSRRRVLLRNLRQRDYKKFEWLLEELNLVYKPRPFEMEDVQRRVHQSRLTELWCDEYRKHQLHQLKRKMDGQKPEFLRHKIRDLKWIMEEEKELGLEATISEDDIHETELKLEQVEKFLAENQDEDMEYHIFDPEELLKKSSFSKV